MPDWIIVGQGPTVLAVAVGAGGGCLDIFFCLSLSGRRFDLDLNTVSKGHKIPLH